jgi:H+/Cl- antiporter ClcA
MKKSSFYFNWVSFVLGLLFGIFGVLFALFAQTDKRDKIYSSLLGCGIGAAISLVLLKYTPVTL